MFGFPYLLTIAIEVLLVIVVCAIGFKRPWLGSRIFKTVERCGNVISRNKAASVWLVGILAVVLRAAVLPLAPFPDPEIHDEFGHLLIADTFASGRLTNPPSPYWRHFESIYLLQQPTYTSQYPIAIGASLAVGQVLLGHPWWGVLIAIGVFCALICWMLQAWVPPPWALLGGLLAVLQFAIVGYWVNTYWGGAVPGIGGLLVLGALPRLRRGHRIRNAALTACGLAILMNSRPVEALLFACVTCAILLWWTLRSRELKFWPSVPTVWLPMGIVLAMTSAGMLYYNYRVTGNALELPYMLHQKMYGSPQAFWWQRPVLVKTFAHKEMEDDYLRQLRLYQRRSSPSQLARATFGRTRDFWVFFIGPAFTVPLLFFPWAIRDRGMPIMLGMSVPFAADYLTFHAWYPHYAGPVAGILIFIIFQCWRHLRVWQWNGKPVGLFVSRMLPLVCILSVVLVLGSKLIALASPGSKEAMQKFYAGYLTVRSPRCDFERELKRMGGKHLIFVRYYQPGHNPDDEWVYNRANIDAADVVWARELDEGSNEALVRHFADRKVWLAEPDARPPRLSPYPVGESHLGASIRKGRVGSKLRDSNGS
jgi:hypothetical protein